MLVVHALTSLHYNFGVITLVGSNLNGKFGNARINETTFHNKYCPGPNLIKLLGVYLGAYLSQINRVRHLNKRLKVL